MRKAIHTDKGVTPRGPYSQAIVSHGPQVFISAQGPVDPTTGEQRLGPFPEQADLVFQNISILLEAAGTSWENVVKMTIYLADDSHFIEMNEIYQRYCVKPYPARTTIRATIGQSAIVADCIALVPAGDA